MGFASISVYVNELASTEPAARTHRSRDQPPNPRQSSHSRSHQPRRPADTRPARTAATQPAQRGHHRSSRNPPNPQRPTAPTAAPTARLTHLQVLHLSNQAPSGMMMLPELTLRVLLIPAESTTTSTTHPHQQQHAATATPGRHRPHERNHRRPKHPPSPTHVLTIERNHC